MNVGPNKGRRLRVALSRFATMLIEEARDISGLSYAKLDEELGLPDGQAKRYSLYRISKKARAPQAASIQDLENRVARLLKRTAHIVVVENNLKIDIDGGDWVGHIEGRPSDDLNLREYDPTDFQLGYEGDWPTYRRLKYSSTAFFSPLIPIHELIEKGAHSQWQEMLVLYAWQWGVVWDRGLPWLNRAEWKISPDAAVESFVSAMTEKAKAERAAIAPLASSIEGRQRLAEVGSYLDLLLDSVADESDAKLAIDISENLMDQSVSRM